MDTKVLELAISKEIIFASAKVAHMPLEEYLKQLVDNKDFVSPTLSRGALALIQSKVALFYAEKELVKIQESLSDVQKKYQKQEPTSPRIAQIDKKIAMIDELLEKMHKLRLEMNYALN